jgi:PAS domain S-box-containing protein
MQWLIDKKTTGIFVFAFTVIVAVNLLALFDLYRFRQSTHWALQTEALIAQLEETRAALLEAESAARGYVITGERSYLGPYREAVPRLEEHLRRTKVLTADDPAEAQQISVLENAIAEHMVLMRAAIRARDTSGTGKTRPVTILAGEKKIMAQIQVEFSEIRSRQEARLKQRSREWQRSAFRTAALLGIGSAIALALLGMAFVATDREIEARQRAEQERDRFFVLSHDLFCVAGYDGYFKRLNNSWMEVLGYSAEELMTLPYLEFVHPEDREATLAEARKLVTGATVVAFENRYGTKSGHYRWLAWTSTPLPERQLIYAVARDVTERKLAEEAIRRLNEELEQKVLERTQELERTNQELQSEMAERKSLQEQLVQAQKMEAIGRLAGGVAHDFNNLLTVINGYAQLLLERAADSRSRAQLQEIHNAGERAVALTRQLLAFSRQQILAPQVLDLNRVVTNIDKMIRRLIGEDIHLVTLCSTGIGRIKADVTQLEQIILNLAVNARDAMPRGGRLTIETANVELDETYAAGHWSVKPGAYVMLAVSDTGVGMDAETRARIFEPFFTTKEKGKGTGLGLATVYGIVKQSGGSIWVYSEPGRGTAFKIYLPRTDEAAQTKPSPRPVAPAARVPATILLAEDEPSVRAMVRGVLESNGYKVLEARDGEDALSIARDHKGPIHLLLSDVVMPRMGGRELAEALAPSHREMKVLFMSGYTDDAIVHHGVLDPDMEFLQKPATPEAIARRVREVLDGTSGAETMAA